MRVDVFWGSYRKRICRYVREHIPSQRVEPTARRSVRIVNQHEEPMRSGLLWLIGVPIPLIIILWLLTGHL
jgi:hypothetical protein